MEVKLFYIGERRLLKRIVSEVMLTLLFIGTLTLTFNIQPVKSTWTGTVYIRADGSIDPPEAPIITYDNVTYTLTDNITSSADGMVVERSNMIIDGNSYTIRGTRSEDSKGISLSGITNVTIKNINIINFYYGIWLNHSSNNSISGNNIINNWCDIRLSYSSNNSIHENTISHAWACGTWFYSANNNIIRNNLIYKTNFDGIRLWSSSCNIIYHNDFVDNGKNVDADLELTNIWDANYPTGGNYWSNYIGQDLYSGPYQNVSGSDGIGDGPYIINLRNIDHYPLMKPVSPIQPMPPPSTLVKVNPQKIEYHTNATGQTFSVNVEIINVTNLYGFDIRLQWNTTFLEYVNHTIKVPRNTHHDGVLWEPVLRIKNEVDAVKGNYWIAYSSMAPAPSFNGTGIAFNMTFRVKYHPLEPTAYTFLALANSDLSSQAAEPIYHGRIHGLIILHTLITPLFASISPLSASILLGQSITFTSEVSGGYPPYSYQWYLNGNTVSGATSDTWTFTPTESGIFYVYLKVADDKGNIAQSETARITVSAVPVGGYSIPIQIPTTAQPATIHIALLTILTAIFITLKRKTKEEQNIPRNKHKG